MEDRFIGYRGSQENEWSWEPDQSTGPTGNGTRGTRNVVFAVLSAFALVTVLVAAVYFVAGAGDDGGGPIVNVTSTPTRRPSASPTKAPTVIPTTPAVTPTLSPSASPSPVPGTPQPGAEFFLWNEKTGKWQGDDLKKDSSDVSEGDVVLFLFKLSGVKPGESYQIVIDYFDCGLSPGHSFDHLGATTTAGDAPQLAAPGPGRVRPDSQVPIPDDPAVANDGGAPTAYLSIWGGTFQHAPELTATPATCAGDKKLTMRVRAQSTTLHVEWGGHVATAVDWLGEGAASAKSPFGMSAVLQGASEERLEVLAGAVSR